MSKSDTEFKSLLKSHATLVENTLIDLLDDAHVEYEIERPSRLMKAMRHSSLDGGKRLRPFLVIESARIFGLNPQQAVFTASALECIHCYSLVHDDLPAMDDDDLRRGKPTTHKAFDEATAILAGDALLTLAFDILARQETHIDAHTRMELVKLYAQNAGLGGMVGGQMLDLEAEVKPSINEQEILTLQAMKTGALIRAACEAGAILGNASSKDRTRLFEFGRIIGQAFQLADDILDVTSDAQTMGKQTAKDADKGKGTLVSLYGLEASQTRAKELLDQAIVTLEPFGEKASILIEAARFTVERKN
jgi:farnesyl diphosphate synthase